jgi:hypothetical protein
MIRSALGSEDIEVIGMVSPQAGGGHLVPVPWVD